jgi:hypothetical protein
MFVANKSCHSTQPIKPFKLEGFENMPPIKKRKFGKNMVIYIPQIQKQQAQPIPQFELNFKF